MSKVAVELAAPCSMRPGEVRWLAAAEPIDRMNNPRTDALLSAVRMFRVFFNPTRRKAPPGLAGTPLVQIRREPLSWTSTVCHGLVLLPVLCQAADFTEVSLMIFQAELFRSILMI